MMYLTTYKKYTISIYSIKDNKFKLIISNIFGSRLYEKTYDKKDNIINQKNAILGVARRKIDRLTQ